MRILITGGKGMLGRTLQQEFQDHELIIADLPEADITNLINFEDFMEKSCPDAVIHCAAMTAVDKCETDIETAFQINAYGTANVAAACRKLHARLIAISTDYVFNGNSDHPYTEDDTPNGGDTIYGKSKFSGEEAIRAILPNHVICRTAWMYGPGGPSFVHTMMNLADGTRPELKIVSDQHGTPTSTLAVARHLRFFLENANLTGTFHLTCEGEASWAEFAAEIFRLAGINQKICPCRTNEYPRPAPRPKNSRLDNKRLRLTGLPPMPDWHDALRDFMKTEFGTPT